MYFGLQLASNLVFVKGFPRQSSHFFLDPPHPVLALS
jgi:hypothetical protein